MDRRDDDGIAVLDLFSGIGALRFALVYALGIYRKSLRRLAEDLKESRASSRNPKVPKTEIYSIDVNDLANRVHKDLEPEFEATKVFKNCQIKAMDVLSLTTGWFTARRRFDLMALSPPCQPYSRRRRQLPTKREGPQPLLQLSNDNRRLPVQHLTLLLSQVPPETLPRIILLENIENFFYSTDCIEFIQTLKHRGYKVVAMVLSPRQIGFPNQRNRLWIVAKYKLEFPSYYNEEHPYLYKDLPQPFLDSYGFIRRPAHLKSFIDEENNRTASALVIYAGTANKRAALTFDIVDWNDTEASSCCFTKNYGRFINGTGSVLYFGKSHPSGVREDKAAILAAGHVRLFSPQEVAKLMGFKTRQPPNFGNALCNIAHKDYSCCPFGPPCNWKNDREDPCRCPTLKLPAYLSNRQAYALLGNSLNPQLLSIILVATGVIEQLYNINKCG